MKKVRGGGEKHVVKPWAADSSRVPFLPISPQPDHKGPRRSLVSGKNSRYNETAGECNCVGLFGVERHGDFDDFKRSHVSSR